MKNLKIFFLSAVVAMAGLFTACSENDWSAGAPAEGPQAYFSAEAPTSYKLTTEDTAVEIPVMRVETEGALEVPVLATIAEEDAALFTVPAYVNFADGEATATLQISFDRASMEDGASYSVMVTLDDPTMTTPYGSSTVTLTFAVPEPYVLIGTASIWDGIVYPLFVGSVPEEPYEVEVYEHLNYPGYLFFKNAYTKEYPVEYYLDFGMTEAQIPQYVSYPEEDVYFYLNASDPSAVVLPTQNIGLNCGYGEMMVGMLSAANAASVEECVGTLKNGVITFPAKKMLIQDNDGMYYANSAGGFKIALPGAILTDYSVEAEAAGHVANNAGQAAPVINVTAGADVAGVAVAFVAGDVTADYASVVEAAASEKPNYTSVVDGACTVIGEDAMEAGQVTAVVVPFDADGVAQTDDAIAITFYFAGCGSDVELPACEIKAMMDVFSAIFGSGYESVYPDSSTLAVAVLGTDIVSAKYSFITGLELTQDLSGADAEEVLAYVESVLNKSVLVDLPADMIPDINGEGLGLYFDELPANTACTFFIEGTNSYGSKLLCAVGGKTADAATPAQQAMMGMKMIQYSGVKAAKIPFANR